MVDAGLHSIIIKVACLGLTAKHLGSSITELEPVMLSLAEKYGCNVCGEGGEFETLTLDGPMFTLGRIELKVRRPACNDAVVLLVAVLHAVELYSADCSISQPRDFTASCTETWPEHPIRA